MSPRIAAAALAGVLIGSVCFAQAPTPAPANPTPTAAASIPVAAISQRGEETVARLRTLGATESEDRDIQNARAGLPANAAEIETLSRQSRAISVGGLTLSDVLDWEKRWTRQQERLSGWVALVQQRVSVLENELNEVDQLDKSWALTQASATKEGVPDALKQQIQTVREQITATASALRTARTDALELQAAIAEQSFAVANEIADLKGRESQLRGQLLVSETEPLWSAVATMVRQQRTGTLLRATVDRTIGDLSEYLRDRPWEVAIQALVLAVLVLAAWRLRGSGRPDEATDEPAIDKLRQRPLSAAVLLMVMGTTTLRTDAPAAVGAVMRIIGVVPLLRLLQIGAFAELPGALTGLGLLVLVSAVSAVLPRAPALARIFQLIECGVFLAWLIWVLRPERLRRLRLPARGRRIARILGRGAMVLLVLAVIANVFGNVVLATLLTSGTYLTVVLALAAQLGAEILDGVFGLFVRSRFGRSMRTLQRHEALVRARFRTGVRFLMFAFWLFGTLLGYAMFPPVFAAVSAILSARLTVGALSIAVGDLFALAVTIWLSFAIARLVRYLLEEEILVRLSLPRGMPGAISVSVSYGIILFGFFAALSAAGVDLGRITVLLGAFGVGLSFGLQTIVNNFVSGLILVFERPIQVGDTIEVEGVKGVVRNIGIRAITLRTADGAEVIVPNGTVLSGKVINWTFSSRGRQIDVQVRVPRNADPQQVIAMLLEAAKANDKLSPEPPPEAYFVAFDEAHFDFTLTAWVHHPADNTRVRSDLSLAVAAALRAAGVEPMPPAPARPPA